MYNGKAVAVKVFSDKTAKINNTTPNYLLRLEVVQSYIMYVCSKHCHLTADELMHSHLLTPSVPMLGSALDCLDFCKHA